MNSEAAQKVDCVNTGSANKASMAPVVQGRCSDAAHISGQANLVAPAPVVIHRELPKAALDIAEESEWNLRLAKEKYKARELDRKQYEEVRKVLKLTYRDKVQQIKGQYRAGTISKSEYRQKILDAKYEYQG